MLILLFLGKPETTQPGRIVGALLDNGIKVRRHAASSERARLQFQKLIVRCDALL